MRYYLHLSSGMSFSELSVIVSRLPGLKIASHHVNGPAANFGVLFEDDSRNSKKSNLSMVADFFAKNFDRFFGQIEVREVEGYLNLE